MTLKNPKKTSTVKEKSEVKIETVRNTVCKNSQGQNLEILANFQKCFATLPICQKKNN